MLRRLGSVLLGLGLLGAAACEGPYDANPLSTPSALAPRAVQISSDNSYRTDSGVTLLLGDPKAPDERQSVVLGRNGGRLGVGANQLTVPLGAVPEDTRFTLTIKNSPYLAAVLSAVQVSDGESVTTFTVPLTLKLSYAKSVTPIPDPRFLEIYWVDNGRILGVQKTVVDKKGRSLYTGLTHFSEYSPGLDGMM